MKLADRRGNIEECSSGQDRLLEWIYTHETGRFLMKGLINPHISEVIAIYIAESHVLQTIYSAITITIATII